MKRPLLIFAIIITVLAVLNLIFWLLNRSLTLQTKSGQTPQPSALSGPSGAPKISPPSNPPPQY